MRFSFIIFFYFLFNLSQAQEATIQIGQNTIAKNQYFTITVTAKNATIRQISDFPDIAGFQKAGTSSSSSTNWINGTISSTHSITQNYAPTKEGKFTLRPFAMSINGKEVKSNGTTITVGAPIQQQQRNTYDPFEDFFGRNRQPQEFVDVQEDAFFGITNDKNEVFVGEGVTYNLAFYVSNANKARMDFYKLDEQLGDILKKVKPQNAWEEPFSITKIEPEQVKINGKDFTKYAFYQTRFYPINDDDIVLPAIGLKMIKYKVAKRQSFFGNNLQEDFKTFYSKPKKIMVKPLPDHPLKDVVAVGNYRLHDAISTDKFETGKSFNYVFKIAGEGNISAIKAPIISENKALQIYPPNERQNINRANGNVTGEKIFDFYIIPSEPGEVDMKTLFQWIYFNPTTAKYDTLTPDFSITVLGESQKDLQIVSTDVGDFYDNMFVEDEIVSLKPNDKLYFWLQLFAGTTIVFSIIIFILRKRHVE